MCIHVHYKLQKLKVENLSFYILQIGIISQLAIQKCFKRPHKKVSIDPLKQAGTTVEAGSGDTQPLKPGFRPDNAWHLYNTASLPDSKEKWENLVVVEKTHWGYYNWPK